jgi:hypothetical protein
MQRTRQRADAAAALTRATPCAPRHPRTPQRAHTCRLAQRVKEAVHGTAEHRAKKAEQGSLAVYM